MSLIRIPGVGALFLVMALRGVTAAPVAPAKPSLWHGFDRHDLEVAGRSVVVVVPREAAPGRPWVWHGEFFGHKPEPDIALLSRGFHAVYTSVPDMFGNPEAVNHWDRVYTALTNQYQLGPKVALVGLSRGGLYCYNWAARNPGRVACLYADAPVCDIKSWPGGAPAGLGSGKGSPRDWALARERFGLRTEADIAAFKGSPVDNLAPLAAARVPLLHVFGDADDVVPWEENTGVVEKRYKALGGDITLIRKPGVGHHPHGLTNPAPIIEFIWKHAASPEAKRWFGRQAGRPVEE